MSTDVRGKDSPSPRRLSADPLILTLLTLSLSLNVYLSFRVVSGGQSAPARPPVLSVGMRVPPLEGIDLDGRSAKLSFESAERTIVYVFTPECSWCARNLQNIKAVAASAGSGTQVIGVSLNSNRDEVRKYVNATKVEYDAVVIPGSGTAQAYRFTGTPETLVIARSGEVREVWRGAYSGATADQVSRSLGITLPGLSQ